MECQLQIAGYLNHRRLHKHKPKYWLNSRPTSKPQQKKETNLIKQRPTACVLENGIQQKTFPNTLHTASSTTKSLANECSQQRDSQPHDRRSEPKMKAVSPPQNQAPPASPSQCEAEPKPEVEEVEDVARLQPEPATQLEAGGEKRFFPTCLLCGCWKRAPKEGEEAKKKVSAVAGLMSRFFPDAEWRAGNTIPPLPHPCHSEAACCCRAAPLGRG